MAYQSTESRNKLVPSYTDPVSTRLVLRDRTPFTFRDDERNINHTALDDDTWWSLAARYYLQISDRPSGLWWVIKDYQPTPVVDPTLTIRQDTLVIVPHPVMVITEILGTEREVFQ